ncbi:MULTISPECIES: general secretion pathway protein GspK [Pseudomonas]|uniref:Type II secretion system protein K n=1 Tax=Pseudomonas quercus TaxID=2722792 RepID=A0ABX0YBB6_9PSED|nr:MULTISPECIES: type II secretion system protein GspK [Pseudomonas]MBF7142108.1 general secretion pathway protein GspK [Pseudomonas sp. LY10J]NJP00646.1 general secretion pathway protein GspK [Pseudomonas quercus]
MALLSVLLVMTLALLLIETLIRQQRITLAATSTQLDVSQLRRALMAGEAMAIRRLPRWEKGKPPMVHLGQPWAEPYTWVLEDGTRVHLTTKDLAGRFNLGVLTGNRPRRGAVSQFEQLLAALDLPAVPLSAVQVSGWRDLSQWRLVPGVTRPWLERLSPAVAWLPEAARLNVNTAAAPVLASLGIPLSVAQRLVRDRPRQGFSTLQAWRLQPGLENIPLAANDLGLTSRWFRLELLAEKHQRRLRLLTDIELAPADGHPRILRRGLRAPDENGPAS